MNAIAMTPCKVLKISRNNFMSLLDSYPQVYEKMTANLSNAMYFKFVMGQMITSQSPATKLLLLMDSEKFSEGDASFFFQNSAYKATDGESHRVVRRNHHPDHQDYGKRKYHQNP